MRATHLVMGVCGGVASAQLNCTLQTTGSQPVEAAPQSHASRPKTPLARPARPPAARTRKSDPRVRPEERSAMPGQAPSPSGARAAPAASGIATPPPLVEKTAADLEAARLFLAELDKPGEALGIQASPPRVTVLGLDNTARGEASGMTADQTILSATLREGQRAATSITVAPDECATFIAQGGLGVIELDLFLTTTGRGPARILAEDRRSGSIAVIGGRGECFLNRGQASLAADLHVRLRRGSGVVIVRAYRRAGAQGSAIPQK
jgi:hypothetical protein